VVAVQSGEDQGRLPAEDPKQRQLTRLQDRHLDSGGAGRGGSFQADPARTDYRNPRRSLEGLLDLVAVRNPAQVEHAAGSSAGHSQPARRGASSQQHPGVADPAAVSQP